MPSNKSYIRKKVEKFVDMINRTQRTPAEDELDKATANMPGTISVIVPDQHISIMGTSPTQANFLGLQTRLLVGQKESHKKAIDLGTFTGGSALAIAQNMPEDGKVISCDMNEEYVAIAQEHWKKAGVADKIDLRIGPAGDTLQQLLDKKGEAGTFDLVFIDADKTGYDDYYEKALQLLRPGGLIILDNMLWSGRVADPTLHDPNTDALRNLNIKISNDERVKPVLLSGEDGVMVVQKDDPERFANLARQRKQNNSKERTRQR